MSQLLFRRTNRSKFDSYSHGTRLNKGEKILNDLLLSIIGRLGEVMMKKMRTEYLSHKNVDCLRSHDDARWNRHLICLPHTNRIYSSFKSKTFFIIAKLII